VKRTARASFWVRRFVYLLLFLSIPGAFAHAIDIQDLITTDFCYGFLEFAPSLRLRLPGGLGFDLARYWDGQGVRFVCCERKHVPSSEPVTAAEDLEKHEGITSENGEDPWGRVFWCVSIEMEE
jgi:hypothetical protein